MQGSSGVVLKVLLSLLPDLLVCIIMSQTCRIRETYNEIPISVMVISYISKRADADYTRLT